MIGNRKEERRRKSMYHFMTCSFSDSPTPSKNRLIAFPKKTKSVPGFEPGSLVALPLAPPPLPIMA